MIQTAGSINHLGHGSADMSDIQLTDRERLIAKEAAKLAIEEMSSEFYKKVGKTIVEKALIWIGLFVVGLVIGKGWIIKV
jgi:hypothetical protein